MISINCIFRHQTAVFMEPTKTKDGTPVPKHAGVDTNQESYFIIDILLLLIYLCIYCTCLTN
jgi:hypothetical protein